MSPPLSHVSGRSHCVRGLQLVSADGMWSPPGKIRTGSSPFGASQMVQTQWSKSLSNWRGGGKWGETQDSGNRHTFQSCLDFSRSLNGSIYKCPQCLGQCGYQGRRLRLVLEVGGGGFCPILSKLLTGPLSTKTNFSFTVSFWGLVPGREPPRVLRSHPTSLFHQTRASLSPSSHQMRPASSHSRVLMKRAKPWSSRVPGVQGSPKGWGRRRPGVFTPSPWWKEKAFFSPSLPLSTAGWICLLAGRGRVHQERGWWRSQEKERLGSTALGLGDYVT